MKASAAPKSGSCTCTWQPARRRVLPRERPSLPWHHPTTALCFVPGFDYSFRESLERAALLAALYSKDNASALVAFVFSWPSDGRLSLSAYLSDRMDAELSGPALARATP